MRNPFRSEKGRHLAPDQVTGLIRSVRVRERRRLGWLRKKWVIIPSIIVLILGVIGGYGLWYYYSLQGDIQQEIGEVTPQEDPEEPFTALLVGSDSREGLTEEEQDDLGAQDVEADGTVISGERADTLIVARIDPNTNRVTMVQFPRDLYVPIANGGSNKINSALLEGKGELVQTVEDLTGLDINVYVQVNIAGFRDLVDAIDGVDVCIPEPIPFDSATGIEVAEEEVGMVHFGGDRALRFVRSRKVFGEGDFARIQNQQKFLSAAVNKVTSVGTFLSFSKLLSIKRAAGKNLKVDSNTDLRELYNLMKRFREFDPDNYEAYTAPNLGVSSNEAGSVVLPDEAAMAAMFEAMASDESPQEAGNIPNDVDPASIRVGIYNGTNPDEVIATPASKDLKDAARIGGSELNVVEVSNADRFNYRKTVVRYESDAAQEAELVAAALLGAKVKEGDTPIGIDVAVIVGKQFEVQRLVDITPIDLPKPGELPAVCR
jgi:LCP family protein required for cell wall assembly